MVKLQDLVKRQSQIIGDLKNQCNLVTDKLESTVGEYEETKAKLVKENQRLKSLENNWESSKREMEARFVIIK